MADSVGSTFGPLCSGSEPKEQQPIPPRAGGFTRYGAQRPVMSALVLEAILQNLHLHSLPAVAPTQDSADDGKAAVSRRSVAGKCGAFGADPLRGNLGPQIGIGGHSEGTLAGALRQIALGQHLQAPCDPADQVHFVLRAGWLAKDLLV